MMTTRPLPFLGVSGATLRHDDGANQERRGDAVARFCVAGSLAVWLTTSFCHAQLAATLDVDASKPGPAIAENFFGLMTEEINHSYDGGLYAELIQNRTFQDPALPGGGGPMPPHWSAVGGCSVVVDSTDPVNAALPVSLKATLNGGRGGVANDGYWGVPVKPDTTYTATFYAKSGDGFAGNVTASLTADDGGATIAEAQTSAVGPQWKKYVVTLTTPHDAPTTAAAKFVLSASGPGSVSFSYVSLFPPTYKGVPNGLRPDLMELLAAMRPKFIRLPGGNYVEGGRFSDRFNWKEMIGPPEERPGHMGCWSYRSSDGLGMPEFLLWCKQLGAEPVLGVFAGYTLNGDHFDAGSPEMEIYTREALEEIEYIMGPADSEWGKKRVADGFPEPFALRYVEIGNEDWFDRSGSYDGRFTQMAKAIRQRYPQLKLIASAPVTSFKPDLYDDHFYRSPSQLRGMFSHYDPRPDNAQPLRFEGGGWTGRRTDGIKTFVGEWAAHEGRPTTNLNAALADAAFVMGLERNGDAVEMQCYAPLLTNVNLADRERNYPRGWQWEHNLIGYDALGSYGSPSYHAQVMLAQHKGDVALATKLDVAEAAPAVTERPRGRVGVGSWHTDVEYADVSVKSSSGRTLLEPAQIGQQAWDFTGGDWNVRGREIRPANNDAETWAIVGDASWTDYTIRLKARKLGGREGFIVMFHAGDGANFQWWNIGGWENTTTRTEASVEGSRGPYGPASPFTVETGRWYDLRLEVQGNAVRGYVDGNLVTETVYEPQGTSPAVYASATYDEAEKAVFVKAVNAGATRVDAAINLRGVERVEPEGTAIVLTGDPGAMNSVAEPRRIAPREIPIKNAGNHFRHELPPHSFSILKLKTTGRPR